MADPKPTSERLDALKARWESDKGSRLFLQLADEYRRLGREEDAVAILDEGLTANPGHVGARVARGRSLLALGRAREATADLEKVIEADPTQMVAYRFLVEGYIQQGSADQARQRLSVYGLLNDADPDIAALDKKIRELERAERTGAWPMPKTDEQPEEPMAAVAEPAAPASARVPDGDTGAPANEAGGSEEPFSETPAVRPAAGEPPLGELSAPEEEPFASPVPPPPQRVAASVDPFPSLTIPEDRRRYLEAFDEDLFGNAPAGAEAAEESAPEPEGEPETDADAVEPQSGPQSGIETQAEAGEPVPTGASDDPFDLASPPQAEAPDLGSLVSDKRTVRDEPPPPPAPMPSSPAVAPAPREEAAPEAETEAGEPHQAETASEPDPVVPAEQEQEAAREPEGERGRATVTLGRLYLRQGHLEEAEESFREVLERNPDNAQALQGLEEIAALRRPEIEVEELLEGYEPARHGEGLTARKRYAMRQYLERLRGGGADVH